MFKPLNEVRVSYAGTSVKVTPPMIIDLQARRCIKDGAVAFLAMVVKKLIGNEEICRIPVVEDFFEVFIDKLSGLLLDREIEFGIELEPGWL